MPDPRRDPLGPGRGRDPFNGGPGGDVPIEGPIGGRPPPRSHLEFDVTSWPGDRLVGRDSVRIHVSGTAKLVVEAGGHVGSTPVGKVEVRLGDGDFQPATRTGLDGLGWAFTGEATRHEVGSPDGGRLLITARAKSGTLRQVRHHTVTVVFDRERPDLTITRPEHGDVVERRGPPYDVVVEGTASDRDTGIERVECGLDRGSLARARSLGRGWKQWRAEVSLPEVGEHEVVARARDRAGNTAEESVTVEVRLEPPVLEIESALGRAWSAPEGLTTQVAGEASDEVSGVSAVSWALDDGPLHEIEPSSGGDRADWRTAIRIPTADTDEVVLRAEDGVGLMTEETLDSNAIWQLFFQALAKESVDS